MRPAPLICDLTSAEIAEALRNDADGVPNVEAAVELLIAHGYWLRTALFRDHIDLRGGTEDEPRLFAAVDWQELALADVVGGTTDHAVLRAAYSLASGDLADLAVTAQLAPKAAALIVAAVKHAAGGTE